MPGGLIRNQLVYETLQTVLAERDLAAAPGITPVVVVGALTGPASGTPSLLSGTPAQLRRSGRVSPEGRVVVIRRTQRQVSADQTVTINIDLPVRRRCTYVAGTLNNADTVARTVRVRLLREPGPDLPGSVPTYSVVCAQWAAPPNSLGTTGYLCVPNLVASITASGAPGLWGPVYGGRNNPMWRIEHVLNAGSLGSTNITHAAVAAVLVEPLEDEGVGDVDYSTSAEADTA